MKIRRRAVPNKIGGARSVILKRSKHTSLDQRDQMGKYLTNTLKGSDKRSVRAGIT